MQAQVAPGAERRVENLPRHMKPKEATWRSFNWIKNELLLSNRRAKGREADICAEGEKGILYF